MKRTANLMMAPALAIALAGCSNDSLVTTGEPADPVQADVVDPSAFPAAPLVCARADQSFSSVEPTVLIVVDQSGSMSSTFGTTSRWSALYDTLMAHDTGAVRRLTDDVRFGLMLFHNDGAAPECPNLDVVAPARHSADDIDAIYAAASPGGDTPTGATMLAAASLMENEPSPTFLVLATDGLPDTCDVPNPDGLPDAQQAVIDATRDAFDAGMPTYVLSVGPDVAEEHLQDVANAGAGAPADGNAPYFVALEPDDLVNAFEGILDGVRFCTFTFDNADFDNRQEGFVVVGARVSLDGRELVEGAEWRKVGDDAVQIIGDACDEIIEGGDHEVNAELLCEMRLR